jgi:deoxycytidylate deaminase
MIKNINFKHLLNNIHPKDVRKARVIAIIFKRNRVISYGFNRIVMSRTELHHTGQARAYWTKHAEADALKKAGRRSNGAQMLVVRIKRDGTFGTAKPCFGCQFLIERAEIKLPVYHS